MKCDMLQLLRDHGIHPSTEGKNASNGWINVRCPFCEDRSDHLGYNLAGAYWHCWKCGSHPMDEVLAELLGISEHDAWIVKRRYELRPSLQELIDARAEQPIIRAASIIVPGDALHDIHRRYLKSRGYDPDQLEKTWGLTGTGPLGPYKFRVICPIWHEGRIVGYQGRDATGRSELRWKSCPDEQWLVARNECLGGIQLATGDACVVVEGGTSAWRLGPGAVWPMGTAFSVQQVRLIKQFRRRFIMFDSHTKDPNAPRRAQRLADMLAGFDGETVLVNLDSGDPGDLPQAEADALMREWRIQKR